MGPYKIASYSLQKSWSLFVEKCLNVVTTWCKYWSGKKAVETTRLISVHPLVSVLCLVSVPPFACEGFGRRILVLVLCVTCAREGFGWRVLVLVSVPCLVLVPRFSASSGFGSLFGLKSSLFGFGPAFACVSVSASTRDLGECF